MKRVVTEARLVESPPVKNICKEEGAIGSIEKADKMSALAIKMYWP